MLCAYEPLSRAANAAHEVFPDLLGLVATTRLVPEFNSVFNNCADYKCKLKKDFQPSQSFNPVTACVQSHRSARMTACPSFAGRYISLN